MKGVDPKRSAWTRLQISLKRPYLPPQKDIEDLSKEPFLFYADDKRGHVVNGKAGDYLSMDRFNYGYDRAGTGENLIGTPKLVAEAAAPVAAAKIAGNATSVELPAAILPQGRTAVEIPRPLMAQVTLRRPAETRQFRVFVGAPADATNLGTDNPYYAGTVVFFGPPMAGMQMSHEAAFAVPLPSRLPVFAAPIAATETRANLAVTVAPAGGKETEPVLQAVSIGRL